MMGQDTVIEIMDVAPDTVTEGAKTVITRREARVVSLMAQLDWTEWLQCRIRSACETHINWSQAQAASSNFHQLYR